jgi:hypothetical protein
LTTNNFQKINTNLELVKSKISSLLCLWGQGIHN